MIWTDLTARLHAEGHLKTAQVADAVLPPESGYGRWLSCAGAWFAAAFLLGFIGALTRHLLESDTFCIVAGSAMLAGGVWLGRSGQFRGQVMIGQFALIACVLGGLLVAKVVLRPGYGTYALLALAALCVPCFLLTREQIQRQLFATACALFLCGAFARHQLTIFAWMLGVAGLVYLAITQDRWVTKGEGDRLNALLLSASLAALLTPLLLSMFGRETGVYGAADPSWISHAFLSSDLAWALLGTISALIVGTVGYRSGLRQLRGFALAAVLGYGYVFYFSIGTTLLHKAYALFSSGAVLLLLRLWTARRVNAQAQPNTRAQSS
jgi:hypothetical protein